MIASKNRNITDGKQYDHLFPAPLWKKEVINQVASVWDTIKFMPKASIKSLGHTKKISKILHHNDLIETCENIWNFVYKHIQYKPDEFGVEQVRSAARLWAERKKGGDCDCYSVFISSILTNLQIPHTFRITKYPKPKGETPNWQHVYIIVPHKNNYITIDCVTDNFNYEIPYLEKIDKIMELHFLNGFDTEGIDNPITGGADAHELLAINGMDGLGRFSLKKSAKNFSSGIKSAAKDLSKGKIRSAGVNVIKATAGSKTANSVNHLSRGNIGKSYQSLKKIGTVKAAGSTVKTVNRYVNPATIALRNGFLLAMKINLFNVAGKIRAGYLPYSEANRIFGLDQRKHSRIVNALEKTNNVYEAAGGDRNALKKGILEGKGNRDGAVKKDGSAFIPVQSTAVPIQQPVRSYAAPKPHKYEGKYVVREDEKGSTALIVNGERVDWSKTDIVNRGDEIYRVRIKIPVHEFEAIPFSKTLNGFGNTPEEDYIVHTHWSDIDREIKSLNGTGLGVDPAVASIVAAASTAVSSIAAMISDISVKKKGDKSEDTPTEDTPTEEETIDFEDFLNSGILPENTKQVVKDLHDTAKDMGIKSLPMFPTSTGDPEVDRKSLEVYQKELEDTIKNNKGVMNWVKRNPLKTAGIGVGVIATPLVIYKVLR